MVVVDAVLELQCSSHQCIEVLHEFCCKEAGVKKADRMSHYNFRKGIALHQIDETYGSRFFQAVIMQRRQLIGGRKRPREEMLLPSSLSAMTVDSSVVCTMTVDSSVCCCFAINKPFVERVGWVTSFSMSIPQSGLFYCSQEFFALFSFSSTSGSPHYTPAAPATPVHHHGTVCFYKKNVYLPYFLYS